jgi:hypothetical protein
MKKYLKYILYTTAGVFILLSSCKQKLDEAYLNPNASVRQPIEVIFPSLIGSFTGSSSAAGSAYGLSGDGNADRPLYSILGEPIMFPLQPMLVPNMT